MEKFANIWTELLQLLRQRVPEGTLQVTPQPGDQLQIQVGDDPECSISLAISDPVRPAFRITYPELKLKRNGDQRLQQTTSEGVLTAAVLWIVDQLVRHGKVVPEMWNGAS